MRTIEVDHHDLDSVEDAKKEIVRQIDAAEKTGARLETPISVALDLQALRQSDDPERRSLADIVSTLSDIQSSMAKIETRVNEFSGLIYWLYEAERRRGGPIHLQPKSTPDSRLDQFSYSYDDILRRILEIYKATPETSTAAPPEEADKK